VARPSGCITTVPPTHGFLDNNGSFTTIDVPGATFTEAYGINNRGQIVGDYGGSGGRIHAFLDDKGTFTTVDPPDSTYAVAYGINDFGQIVGNDLDSTGMGHAFLETNGTYTDVNVPGASSQGINDLGQIVGSYGNSTGVHGFLTNGFLSGKLSFLSGSAESSMAAPASVSLTSSDLGSVFAASASAMGQTDLLPFSQKTPAMMPLNEQVPSYSAMSSDPNVGTTMIMPNLLSHS
jgi:probable HAF family extracellular repeat protein